jgi:TIR domain
MNWDIFISHASEDKELVARPLADLLRSAGVTVWLDENELSLGDSLRTKIDQGLAESRFGVVILSMAFFAKDWPQRELNGLAALESPHRKVILPIWHGVDQAVVARYSPLLASKLAVCTDKGLGAVATEVLKVVIPMRAEEIGLALNSFFPDDRTLFAALTDIFNRPAFRGPFLWQTDPVPFQRAIKLTLKSINTGVVEDNSGVARNTISPITRIRDAKLYASMQQVATQLKTIDNLIEMLIELRKKAPDSPQLGKIITELDTKRDTVIGALNKIWLCFGLHTLPIPTDITESTDVWEYFPGASAR